MSHAQFRLAGCKAAKANWLSIKISTTTRSCHHQGRTPDAVEPKAAIQLLFDAFAFALLTHWFGGLRRGVVCQITLRRLGGVRLGCPLAGIRFHQLVKSATDPFNVQGNEDIVDVLGELVSRPSVSAGVTGDTEPSDGMAMERRVVPVNRRVVAVNPHNVVVMRDGKGQDLPMQLLLARHGAVQRDDGVDGNAGAVSVLSVGDVERCVATFHLRHEERKIQTSGRHDAGSGVRFADGRPELLKLVM